MPRHGDGDAHETGRRTLTDADIEVVTLQPRIGRSGVSHRAPTIYQPSDGWDIWDRRPPPPVDLDDYGVDNDHFDGDILANP